MSKAANFFSDFRRGIKLSLYVCAPARVVSYNSINRRADVQPLYISEHEDGTSGQWPMIEDAPVLEHVGDLVRGDTVLLLFGDRAIDNLRGSQAFKPGSSRLHSLTDAFVIGKI